MSSAGLDNLLVDWKILEATEPAHFEAAMELFSEYISSLDFDLSFQNVEQERSLLPTMYGRPTGCFFLVQSGQDFIGCAGVRQIENDQTCELKRMYIKPPFQGIGIGRALMEKAIETAQALGYSTMKLDTIGYKMPRAVKLYERYGFLETQPYNYNPHKGVKFFTRQL
ncbi:GNAT family N-acetyltransferase [Arundinibacter roseus]|uniref:GNAT family N-acetyltransferase n=1 Tax=Arundinibacter roseus TaxID=2070510 RepID=A0A4R4KF10_9BACT|nr:GNAT family N-acetyltransferase [Arundinibacter roseus]TDB65151.1 GNAT family N-acetyltransferase [Arundinibacter roseus]